MSGREDVRSGKCVSHLVTATTSRRYSVQVRTAAAATVGSAAAARYSSRSFFVRFGVGESEEDEVSVRPTDADLGDAVEARRSEDSAANHRHCVSHSRR